MSARSQRLRRLLAPRSIVVAGGRDAAEVIRQCRRAGFAGELWALNPNRDELAGVPCFRSVAALPAAPDACFLAVPREATVSLAAELAGRGAGGAVCYASGFAETGEEGAHWQQRLLEAAGDMALLGPNCYGLLNHLDGSALWPDRAGGRRVARGVALLTQSGNIGLNLSMQAHHLPVAYVAALGNQAQLQFHQLIEALLEDERVSAIGLHIEGLTDVPAFSRAALAALARGVPIVALKTGASELGARLTASHTSALASPDALVDALFERTGIVRTHDLPAFLETLKLLHVCGPLAGRRIGSLSCSGGEASLVADLGERAGLTFPPLPAAVQAALHEVLGPRVGLANPLDYQTYIWADEPALRRCFEAMLQAPVDATLLVLDVPSVREPGEPPLGEGWQQALDAFIAARPASNGPVLVVSTLAELMPEAAAQRLLEAGIAPMQGLGDALQALAAAAWRGQRRADGVPPVAGLCAPRTGPVRTLDEPSAKLALAAHGLRVPQARVVGDVDAAVDAAARLGGTVALKSVSPSLTHKSEAGAVVLGLRGETQVRAALAAMPDHGRWLVEEMVTDGLAEIVVGVLRDPQFGLVLMLGAGGVLVELLADRVLLLAPVTRADIGHGLRRLRCFPLLDGYRGRPRADLDALVEAVEAVWRFAGQHADRLVELDVNPLIARPRGAMAVDALVRWVE